MPKIAESVRINAGGKMFFDMRHPSRFLDNKQEAEIVALWRSSKNNSAKALAAVLEYSESQINTAINRYLAEIKHK